MADMVATLGLGLDASQLTLGLPNVERLLQNVATAATAAKTAQASYNTAAKIAAPSSNASDITAQFRALQALNEAKKVAAQTEQTLAAAQASRMEIARTMQPLIIANTQIQLENVKAILAGVNATSAQIAMDANAAMAKRDEAAAAAAATAATQALGAAQAAAIPATQAAATATQALAQQQAAVVPAAQAAAAATNAAKEANEKAEKQAVTLRDVLAKLGLAYTGGQVMRAVGDVLTLAARYQTLGVVLDVVGRNVGKSRQEMRDLSESLQETGISAIASREELARMAAANLNLSQASEVARVAQNAAVIAGVNSSAAFERVITAITTQQPRVLRTIGIYVNFEAAQEKYAKAAGRRMEQLTGQERAQINLDTALKGGAQVVGAYAAAMDTAGKQLTSTVRYMQDMKTQLGETFLPEFTFAVKAYAATLKFVGDNASWLAPILGGVLVTAVLLAASAVAVLAAGLVAITLPFSAIVAAVAAGVAAMAFFGFTAKKARESTADLNKKLDEDSVIVTAYTQKIQKMSVALLEAEKRQLALRGAADFDLLSGLGSEVIAARKTVDAKPDYRATLAERSQTAANNVAALAAAEKAYADALRMSGIREQEAASLLQELSKRSTEAAGATDDATEAADKAAKKFADYQKALREANDALLISAAAMDAGAAPTLAQQRALEDLNIETELAAKILDIKAAATGKDADYTKAQAAQLILLTQQTAENTAATLVRTRAYEDWLVTLEKGEARWEKEREAKEKSAEIQAEETKRINEAIDARDKAVQSVEDALKVMRDEVAIAQTKDAGQKRELTYLTLRTAKFKEYLEATRVGSVADPKAAEDLTNKFMGLTRLQDALKDKSEAWGGVLKDVVGVAQSIAGAFGDFGRQIKNAISALAQVYEIMKKVNAAAATAKAAQAAANANATTENIAAASAAGSAASATKLAGGLSIGLAVAPLILEAANAMDLFGTKARENARLVREAANSMEVALTAFDRKTKEVAGSFASDIADVMESLSEQVQQALIAAFGPTARLADGTSGVDYLNLATINATRNKAAGYAQSTTTTDELGERIASVANGFDVFANGLQRILDSVNQRIQKLTYALISTLDTYYNTAFGNDALNQIEAAKQQWIKLTQDISAAFNAGGLTLEQYETQLDRLNDAYTENIRKINEEIEAKKRQEAERVRRSVFDTQNATRAFTDPRGAGLAALDENAARRYNDAATAAEKAAVALFNVAERADYLAKQLEADRRTTEGLTNRILATLGDDRETQNQARTASQRQEMADAIASGMSETNRRLLELTHIAENSYAQMIAAIEDGTAAINSMRDASIAQIEAEITRREGQYKEAVATVDANIKEQRQLQAMSKDRYNAQIDAIKDATKAQLRAIDGQVKTQQAALKAAQTQVAVLEKVYDSLQQLSEFSDSLKLGALSTLSPERKLTEARRQFDVAAASGDPNQIPAAATALLEASREFNASGQGFVTDYNRVQSVLTAALSNLPIDMQTLLVAKQQVESLQTSIEALQEQKQAIQDTSAAEILILEVARDIADKGFADTIQKMEETKDILRTLHDAWIEEQRAQIKKINEAADKAVKDLVIEQKAAHKLRVDTATNTFNTSENTAATVTELKSAVGVLKQQVLVDSEAAQVMTGLLTQLVGAVNSGNAITRRSIESKVVA